MSDYFPLPLCQQLHNKSSGEAWCCHEGESRLQQGDLIVFFSRLDGVSPKDPLVVVTVHSAAMGNRPIKTDQSMASERTMKSQSMTQLTGA